MNNSLTLSRYPPVCDFCSSKKIVGDIKAKSFDMPEFGLGSITDWAACRICLELIKAKKWEELENRSVKSFFENQVEAGLEVSSELLSYAPSFVHALHKKLRENFIGIEEKEYIEGQTRIACIKRKEEIH